MIKIILTPIVIGVYMYLMILTIVLWLLYPAIVIVAFTVAYYFNFFGRLQKIYISKITKDENETSMIIEVLNDTLVSFMPWLYLMAPLILLNLFTRRNMTKSLLIIQIIVSVICVIFYMRKRKDYKTKQGKKEGQ